MVRPLLDLLERAGRVFFVHDERGDEGEELLAHVDRVDTRPVDVDDCPQHLHRHGLARYETQRGHQGREIFQLEDSEGERFQRRRQELFDQVLALGRNLAAGTDQPPQDFRGEAEDVVDVIELVRVATVAEVEQRDLELEDVIHLHGLLTLQDLGDILVEEAERVFRDLHGPASDVAGDAVHQPDQYVLHVHPVHQRRAGLQERFQRAQVEFVGEDLDDAVH